MKKPIIFLVFIFLSSLGYSQEDDGDRTDFKGEVLSTLMVVEQSGSDKELEQETIFFFDSKTISIDDDVFDIVNKEFDGIDTNTFLCTKRSGNFTITFIVDEYINIFDNSNPNTITYYMDLVEQTTN